MNFILRLNTEFEWLTPARRLLATLLLLLPLFIAILLPVEVLLKPAVLYSVCGWAGVLFLVRLIYILR